MNESKALIAAIICVVIAIGMMLMVGCEPIEGFKSDRRNLDGCEPTGLYVLERNPQGVRQIYNCVP
ncbi:hypothetical protein LCGC14_1434720 [marine sediment metagenome]|uniref:Uncharacterized protein n=1 Tax=marine sediment metagenome TaxID=412755 RepID=A0A0F9JN25_9ZZZZ